MQKFKLKILANFKSQVIIVLKILDLGIGWK